MKQIETALKFQAFAESRIGGRTENQDTCAWQDTPHGFLILVCDGMGGGPSGKVASQMAADAIVNSVLDSNKDSHPTDVIARAVKAANKALAGAQETHPDLAGMGTTMAALLINEYSAIVAHIGDSRVYQLRRGHKIFRTYDHSQVFEMLRAGAFKDEEEALSRANANVITRAIGPMTDPQPDIVELPYEKGDRFVLCSDGLWGAMPEKQFCKIAGNTPSLPGAVESLAITADENGVRNGGMHDNLTLAIVQTTSNSKLKQKMSTKARYAFITLLAICCLSLTANFIQYRSNRNSGPATGIRNSSTASTDIEQKINDLIVQNEKLQKRLEENERRIHHQDSFYVANLRKLSESSGTDHETKSEKMNSDKNTTGVTYQNAQNLNQTLQAAEAVQRINQLIAKLETLKKLNKKNQLKAEIEKAQTQFELIEKDVKQFDAQNEKFNKCAKEKWIKQNIMLDPSHDKRVGHINIIIKTLTSVRDLIKTKSEQS